MPGVHCASIFSSPDGYQTAIPAKALRDKGGKGFRDVGQRVRSSRETEAPARAAQLHRQVSVLANLHVLAADTFDRLPPERTECTGYHRQSAESVGDAAPQRYTDRIFDRLITGRHACGRISHAEISADGAHERIRKAAGQLRQRIAVESGVDVRNHDDITASDR